MTATIESRVRSVLDAPRGRRFSRPGATLDRPSVRRTLPETPQEREARLLRQMAGNPKVAYRLEHGVLPHWMHVARQQQEQAEQEAREAASIPEEPVPARPRGRHRAPRRWWAWPAVAVSVALLFGQTVAEVVGEGVVGPTGGLLI